MRKYFFFIYIFLIVNIFCDNDDLFSYEQKLLLSIPYYDKIPHISIPFIKNGYEEEKLVNNIIIKNADFNPLFNNYKGLYNTLSYIKLGDFPTPIIVCENLNYHFRDNNVLIYIKNDGLAGIVDQKNNKRLYGGNELRKLQYLLAHAIENGHNCVVTFGGIGSNHALQTAICARGLGLNCLSFLMPQFYSPVIQKNLLLQKAYRGNVIFCENAIDRALFTMSACILYKQRYGRIPYIIPVGGSNARGAIGYVEAAFELKDQINNNIIAEPDHIYVALGSGGTTAGLLLGFQAAQINSRVHLVAIEPENEENVWVRLEKLFTATNDLLISLDQSFPRCIFMKENYILDNKHSGTEYGRPTIESNEAVCNMKKYENIRLDDIYTGKCFSALWFDLENNKLNNCTVLFWNTFCGEDMTHITDTIDYHSLPIIFHSFFKNN